MCQWFGVSSTAIEKAEKFKEVISTKLFEEIETEQSESSGNKFSLEEIIHRKIGLLSGRVFKRLMLESNGQASAASALADIHEQ